MSGPLDWENPGDDERSVFRAFWDGGVFLGVDRSASGDVAGVRYVGGRDRSVTVVTDLGTVAAQANILAAFNLEPWHVGLAPVPWRVRLWAPVRRLWFRFAGPVPWLTFGARTCRRVRIRPRGTTRRTR